VEYLTMWYTDTFHSYTEEVLLTKIMIGICP